MEPFVSSIVFLAGATEQSNVEVANTRKEMKETVFLFTRILPLKKERYSIMMKTMKSLGKVNFQSTI